MTESNTNERESKQEEVCRRLRMLEDTCDKMADYITSVLSPKQQQSILQALGRAEVALRESAVLQDFDLNQSVSVLLPKGEANDPNGVAVPLPSFSSINIGKGDAFPAPLQDYIDRGYTLSANPAKFIHENFIVLTDLFEHAAYQISQKIIWEEVEANKILRKIGKAEKCMEKVVKILENFSALSFSLGNEEKGRSEGTTDLQHSHSTDKGGQATSRPRTPTLDSTDLPLGGSRISSKGVSF